MGHSIPLYLIVMYNNLLLFDFVYIILFYFHFFPLYIHNILYIKNVYFHIYILNWCVYRILSANFFLLNIPLFAIQNILVEFLPTCGLGLDIALLKLFLFLFLNTVFKVYFLYLFLIVYILLVFYILVRKLYDICISSLYAIKYFYP